MVEKLESFHINEGGLSKQPTTNIDVKQLQVKLQAREDLIKVCIGGGIISVLTIAYLIGLANNNSSVDKLLGIIGLGIGYLLGSQDRKSINKN